MYTLAVKRDFVAQHFLVGGDWGAENERHSHHYVVELQLEGSELDQHNYLADITDVEKAFVDIVNSYKDKTLNALPEFADTNPSIELFARIVCQAFVARVTAPNMKVAAVRIWENEIAWASYRIELA